MNKRCTASVWSRHVNGDGVDIPARCKNKGPRCHLHREGARYGNTLEFASQMGWTKSLCGVRMREYERLTHESGCKACLRRWRWNNRVRIARECAEGAPQETVSGEGSGGMR